MWRLLLRLQLRREWLALHGALPEQGWADRLESLEKELKVADTALIRRTKKLARRMQDLEAELERAAPAKLPASGWERPDHEALLRMVLHREDVASAILLLPSPVEMHTGVEEVSQVYTLSLSDRGRTWAVVAKFDEEDRAREEWRAIERLRQLPLPAEMILPLGSNRPGDGVMVSQAASTAHSHDCQTLAGYFTNHLLIAHKNCRACLDKAFPPLRQYYAIQVRDEDEQRHRPLDCWRDVFPKLQEQLEKFTKSVVGNSTSSLRTAGLERLVRRGRTSLEASGGSCLGEHRLECRTSSVPWNRPSAGQSVPRRRGVLARTDPPFGQALSRSRRPESDQPSGVSA